MAKAQIKPLFDRVLVTLAKREKETASGMILPETEKMEKGQKAEVIYMRDGKTLTTEVQF